MKQPIQMTFVLKQAKNAAPGLILPQKRSSHIEVAIAQVAISAIGISTKITNGKTKNKNKLNPKLIIRFLNILIIMEIKSTHIIRYKYAAIQINGKSSMASNLFIDFLH